MDSSSFTQGEHSVQLMVGPQKISLLQPHMGMPLDHIPASLLVSPVDPVIKYNEKIGQGFQQKKINLTFSQPKEITRDALQGITPLSINIQTLADYSVTNAIKTTCARSCNCNTTILQH